jgi:hypothetical protein
MWLGFLLLLGLLVFIILDGRRLRSAKADPISRDAMTRGFVPRGCVQWRVCFGMSAMSGALALMEWQSPSAPPFTGRSRWLYEFAYNEIGERGAFCVLALFCGALACLGLTLWQHSKQQ